MGQLTLLKNVPERGGGGFEKLYESTIGSTFGFTGYSSKQAEVNFLDYDILLVVVSDLWVVATTSNRFDAEVSVSLSSIKNDDYRNNSLVLNLGTTEITGVQSQIPVRPGMAAGFVVMGKKSKDSCAIVSSGVKEKAFANTTYGEIPSDTNLRYVGVRVGGTTGYSHPAETKITIYGMGKRK